MTDAPSFGAPSSFPVPDTVLVRGGDREGELPTRADGVDPAALDAAQSFSDAHGGSSLLIWRDDALVHERYGPQVGPDTRLNGYSLAKTVLGLMFGVAAAKGVIQLDAPVSRYLEEWRGDPRGDITLDQLLTMRSGLKLYSLPKRESGAMTLLFGKHITAAALETPLVRPPGEMFEYANINAFLAGLALDRALTRAGLGRYAEVLSETLWRPLGQSDSLLSVDGPEGVPRFFAGLDATARDWLRLGLLMMEAGSVKGCEIVPAAWLAQMTMPSGNPNYGRLIWLGQPWTAVRSYGPSTPSQIPCVEPYLADDMIFFDGAGGQRVYVSQRLRLVIVRTGAQSPTWEDSELPNTIIRGFI